MMIMVTHVHAHNTQNNGRGWLSDSDIGIWERNYETDPDYGELSLSFCTHSVTAEKM